MFGLVTYFAIFAFLGIGTWFRPAVGVAAILCLFGLKQWGQSSASFILEHGRFTNYAMVIIAVVGLIRAALKRSCVFCATPTSTWLIASLLLYALLSVVWAPDPAVSWDQWVEQGPYIITIAVLAPLLVHDFADARVAVFWTWLTGAAICILALSFGKWGLRGLLLFHDLQDSETNPLALSSLAGTVFVISALSLGRSRSSISRILSIVFIPITLAVILKSGSRGQFIASVAAVMVALPIAFRIRDLRSIAGLILAAAIIVGVGTWGASLVDIDASRWYGSDPQNSVAGRIDNAQRLLEAATSSPMTTLFGLGNSSAFHILGIYPHIAVLEVFAEEGIVGAILYFAVIFASVRSIKRIGSRPDLDDMSRNLLAVLTGLFVFQFVLSWKQESLLSSFYVFAYAITLGKLEEAVAGEEPAEESALTAAMPRFQNLMR